MEKNGGWGCGSRNGPLSQRSSYSFKMTSGKFFLTVLDIFLSSGVVDLIFRRDNGVGVPLDLERSASSCSRICLRSCKIILQVRVYLSLSLVIFRLTMFNSHSWESLFEWHPTQSFSYWVHSIRSTQVTEFTDRQITQRYTILIPLVACYPIQRYLHLGASCPPHRIYRQRNHIFLAPVSPWMGTISQFPSAPYEMTHNWNERILREKQLKSETEGWSSCYFKT